VSFMYKICEPGRLESRSQEIVQVSAQTSYVIANSMKEITERFPAAHSIEWLGPFIDIRHER